MTHPLILRGMCLVASLALAGCAATKPAPAPAPAAPVAVPTPAPVAKPAAIAAGPVKRPKPAPDTATLKVTVEGVLPQKSELLVGLYDKAHYATKKPPFTRDGPAKAPETVVTFTDIPPGRYAVKILQDLNGNRDMDSTLLGVPEEPFGLSNDIKPKLAEPGFDETGIDLKPGANAIVIHMQQM